MVYSFQASNHLPMRFALLVAGLVGFVTSSRADDLATVAKDARIDFNRDIRPILNEHCIACHGGVKQAADVSFSYSEQALEVIEPGSPDDSYMMERIQSEDEDRMPPPEHGRALNAEEVALLKQWIKEGAEWGLHWSFVKPQRTTPPALTDDNWSRTLIDPFVLQRLRIAGLEPADAAAPDRWLRRVTLDLVGLPPSPEDRSAFLASLQSIGEEAYEQKVDELLASPAFGERWGSVWLDLVRYADSKGLGQDGRRSIWKYRDWVIKAFNDDMPYDQFTIKQMAGDMLPDATMEDKLATACHRLTQSNEEGGTDDEQFRIEAVLDRVNTTWQAWQGVSFGCVQCHSHPYDPFRHEEYYTFAAFFNNTMDCDLDSDAPNLMVPLDEADVQRADDLDRQINKLRQSVWEQSYELAEHTAWTRVSQMNTSTNNTTQVTTVSTDGYAEFRTKGTVSKSTTFTFDVSFPAKLARLNAIRFVGMPENAEQAFKDAEWGFILSHMQAEWVLPTPEDSTSETNEPTTVPIKLGYVISDEPFPLIDPQESLNEKSPWGAGAYTKMNLERAVVFVLDEPADVPSGASLRVRVSQDVFELGAFPLVSHRGRLELSDGSELTDWWQSEGRRTQLEQLAELERQRRDIRSVPTPVLTERHADLMRPSFVFDRGNFLSKSERVTPQTPEVLGQIETNAQGATRLELARWLASPNNPLTARVYVNRIWAQLFGVGIVETQEDFGSAGDAPSHPELLDDLAVRFMEEMNWSTKSLLRELTLSATYRQNAKIDAVRKELDPHNRLLSRGPRVRLPAETVRDSALSVAGLLSTRAFGAPVHPPLPEGVWQPFQAGDKWNTPDKSDPDRYRRTIYTYTKRTIPFPVMAAFDAPSREFCSTRRLRSNTPLQALMTLNDATFVEASEAFAKKMIAHSESITEQLQYGFTAATSREPTASEINALKVLYENLHVGTEAESTNKMAVVASVLINLDEFLVK